MTGTACGAAATGATTGRARARAACAPSFLYNCDRGGGRGAWKLRRGDDEGGDAKIDACAVMRELLDSSSDFARQHKKVRAPRARRVRRPLGTQGEDAARAVAARRRGRGRARRSLRLVRGAAAVRPAARPRPRRKPRRRLLRARKTTTHWPPPPPAEAVARTMTTRRHRAARRASRARTPRRLGSSSRGCARSLTISNAGARPRAKPTRPRAQSARERAAEAHGALARAIDKRRGRDRAAAVRLAAGGAPARARRTGRTAHRGATPRSRSRGSRRARPRTSARRSRPRARARRRHARALADEAHFLRRSKLASKVMALVASPLHKKLLNLAHDWLRTYLPHVLAKVNRVSFWAAERGRLPARARRRPVHARREPAQARGPVRRQGRAERGERVRAPAT